MTKIEKSSMLVDGNSVHMSMPFAKVDEAKRTVSGWATLDNIDTQGDVVLSEASVKAFARARGNIREMHQPLAVGRLVNFVEKEYLDSETGDLYRGIYVTARVSEGAPDTWAKVLDGTLQGFSIGGEINEASNEFVKDAGRTVRFIKDYDLTELSLVDNPANQLANVDSFHKSVFSIDRSESGSVTVKGMIAETSIDNVFICKTNACDNLVVVDSIESSDCPQCGVKMENIGWFESDSNRAEKVSGIVNKFLRSNEQEVTPNSNGEGGVKMPEENELETENPEVEETEDEVQDDETVEDAPVEEGAADLDEVEDADEVVSKKIDELHVAISDSIKGIRTETTEQYANLEKKIDENYTAFMNKASELEEKIGGFDENLSAAKVKLAELEKSLTKVNNSQAFRKSADVETTPVPEQKKSFWGNAFSD